MKSYSKSVSSLSSARGWKTKALFLMPSTQAESAELAKIRPAGLGLKKIKYTLAQEAQEVITQVYTAICGFNEVMSSPCL